MTVDEVCKEVGICRKTYYNYANGSRQIPENNIIALAKLFECTTDYLLGIKNYTHITIVDNMGGLIADIGEKVSVEHEDYKVIFN